MEPEIRPPPQPEERAAILAALERLLQDDGVPAGYGSAWRERGMRENLDDPAESGRDRSFGSVSDGDA